MFNIILSTAALAVSAAAIFCSIVFYYKSTRRLQNAVNVLGTYLEACMRDADVKLMRNNKADVVGISITLHAQPCHIQIKSDSAVLNVDK